MGAEAPLIRGGVKGKDHRIACSEEEGNSAYFLVLIQFKLNHLLSETLLDRWDLDDLMEYRTHTTRRIHQNI